MSRLFLILMALMVLSSCVGPRSGRPLELKDAHVAVDTVWQGRIVIDGAVRVAKGATLTIRPGTDISFVRRDRDADGLGDGTLIVEGTLEAIGSRQEPIVFRSAEADPQPGDWLEIRVDFSRSVHFRHCEIRDSAHTLHAHFTRGRLEDSHIHGNYDGCRLGEARFVIRNNLFEDNVGKAINFRNSTVEITRNIIRRNGSGIFLFETDRESDIHHNNIHDNIDNVRLGDFFTGTVSLRDNWWGSADPQKIRETIHDSRVDPAIGTVRLAPASGWVERTGPRAAVRLEEAWRFTTGGFVDASVVEAAGRLIVGSWDGRLTALDRAGRPLWSRQLGDVIDATPGWDGRAVFVQTWSRELFAIDPADGRELWRFGYAPSPADDHRQGGIVVFGDTVLLPAWNGTLYALDAATGLRRWQYDAGFPLRAAPVVDGDRVYVASGDGTLTALGPGGDVLWRSAVGAPLLAAPARTPDGPVALARDGLLVAFDRGGKARWRKRLDETCFYSSPLVHDGSLYVGTAAGTLWKLDAVDGRTIWDRPGFGPIYATPRLVDDRILVGDNDGNLSLVGAESGTVHCQFRLDGDIQGTPLVTDGLIVIGSRDRTVYGLRTVEREVSAHADD